MTDGLRVVHADGVAEAAHLGRPAQGDESVVRQRKSTDTQAMYLILRTAQQKEHVSIGLGLLKSPPVGLVPTYIPFIMQMVDMNSIMITGEHLLFAQKI